LDFGETVMISHRRRSAAGGRAVNGDLRDDQNEAACQDLSSPDVAWGGFAERSLRAYSGACAVALGNVDALLKSQEIAWRGLCILQNACRGTMQMAMHEQFADVRTRMSCQSLTSMLSLERDLAGIGFSRISDRALILGRMIMQTAEDVSVPLWRRCDIDLDELAGCRH